MYNCKPNTNCNLPTPFPVWHICTRWCSLASWWYIERACSIWIIYSEHCFRLTPFTPDLYESQMKIRVCGLLLSNVLLSYCIISYRIIWYIILYHIISYHNLPYHVWDSNLVIPVPLNVLAPIGARLSTISRYSDECKLRCVLPRFLSHHNVIYSLVQLTLF